MGSRPFDDSAIEEKPWPVNRRQVELVGEFPEESRTHSTIRGATPESPGGGAVNASKLGTLPH
jgi:hypothetical protein